ncbi:concanavalin A-like lectin/glucanase domain, Xyloglucan endotransglucosylase/hydrolase [Artemisia annua]|uniref:Xyloglucan endotransglucosylase/hydrolase n=1 Tax=Artemisia annua TaxID=35608 RepID=A0A2U1KV67_ARTAN|nr:concanavalin A-like lectin/glucanase domain, Xyloglucan endotransglucosylase/hydrolase [Artemisia annua]
MLFYTCLQFVIFCTIATLKPSISLNLSTVSFNEVFSPLYGNQDVKTSDNGKSVQISINRWSTSGSGFVSQNTYNSGLFTASIKLPNNGYTAGVVATFYLRNNEVKRDEIDFEFLGHVEGEEWSLQTNVYGNGSYNKGREERYSLPFDPSLDFHNYSILWDTNRIIFFVDQYPIRETENSVSIGGNFPSKPMYVYATIWDGSDWATHHGKYKLILQRGPFVASYYFIINACRAMLPECNIALPGGISADERLKMIMYRALYMSYSYCHDKDRYPDSLPECRDEGYGMQPVQASISKATRRLI